MALNNVCRLCLSESSLVWVFDKRFENSDSMRSVVYITTGVQIHRTDDVSQKICETCCHIIVNFFEFRKKSLRNNRLLKDKLKAQKDSDGGKCTVSIKVEPIDTSEEPRYDHTPLPIHPTVRELFELHPHVKLPRTCLTADIKPFVVLPMNSVESYYGKRKLDFQEHCSLALKQKRTARKKTLRDPETKRTPSEGPICLINGRVIPQQTENSNVSLVRPMKIKINLRHAPKENATETDKDKINESESIPNDTQKPSQRKRKLSDEESPTKENEKPKENYVSSDLNKAQKCLSFVANVSVPLHLCNICDSVHYTAKELKKHRLKHLRCQFCKAIFRSLQNKNEHLENKCSVKSTINNFPSVKVPKIEMDLDVVKRYPNAFSEFPSLIEPPNEVHQEMVILNSDSDEDHPKAPLESTKSDTAENALDVIEILSDDDDTSTRKDPSAPPAKVPEVIQAIKPHVNIRNSTIQCTTDQHANEVQVLKNLLTEASKLDVSTSKEVQTETPQQHNIEINEQEQSATFSHLQQHLHVFRVPVQIKNGRSFSISYNFSTDKEKKKNLLLWNRFAAVDIKQNTGTAGSAQHADSSSGASTLDQEKPVAKEGTHLPSTSNSSVQLPSECDKGNTVIVPHEPRSGTLGIESKLDQSVKSIHNDISIVQVSAASNLHSIKTVSPPTSCSTTNVIPPPPYPTNVSVSAALSSAPVQGDLVNVTLLSPQSSVVTSTHSNPPSYAESVRSRKEFLNAPNTAISSKYYSIARVPSNNNSFKPVSFKTAQVYKNKSQPVSSSTNICHQILTSGKRNRSEDTKSSTAASNHPINTHLSHRSPTVFHGNIDSNTPIIVTPSPQPIASNVTESNATSMTNKTSSLSTCHSALCPTAYSVGYSNVPVMVIGGGEGSAPPKPQHAYSMASSYNSYPPQTILNRSVSVPVPTITTLPVPPTASQVSTVVHNSESRLPPLMSKATSAQRPQLENILSRPQTKGLRTTVSNVSNPPNVCMATDGNIPVNNFLSAQALAGPNSVSRFAQATGHSLSSIQSQPSLERSRSAPADTAPFGNIRVRNMKELT